MEKVRLLSIVLTVATWLCLTAMLVLAGSGAGRLLSAAFCLSTLSCALVVLDVMIGRRK